MTRPILAALVLLAATAILPRPAAAQTTTARPSVDCSLLTPQQAYGLPCAAPARPAVVAPPLAADAPTGFDADCQNVNPYEQGEKAAECARRPLPGASTPVFLIGHVYALGYNQLRATVIGLATDRDGVQVVTLSWLPESLTDGVIAVRTPPAPGGRSNWIYVGPAQ